MPSIATADGLRGQLVSLLQQAFGSQAVLASYRVDKRLHDYAVVFARMHSPRIDLIIKLAGPHSARDCRFEQTARLHEVVRQQTCVPVAEILAVDVSYRVFPWRYLIARHIRGHLWAEMRSGWTAEALADAQFQLGEAVGQLHTIGFPNFGVVGTEGEICWMPALAQRAGQFIRGERSRELFLTVLEQQTQLFVNVRQPELCHEDLHAYNILFQPRQDRWQLAAILDFDKSWAGHTESDLARLELWRGMTGNAFWQAYRSVRTVDQAYEQRRALYQLFWCLEYASPSPDHLADTRRVCETLGLPPVERFD
ncbi:MAG: phosphotransferase family protein [Chloroflexota bacterium]